MKNRFSKLLDGLIDKAKVKHYVLAEKLGYDNSYISKWVNGKMMPGEKNSESIIKSLAEGIVENGSTEGIRVLIDEYNVFDQSELKQAIYDHMLKEFNYVKELKDSSGSEIAPEVQFFPEMNLRTYIKNMKHPALRKVQDLHIICAMDLIHMAHDFRLELLNLTKMSNFEMREYPNVHFSVVLDLSINEEADCIYDVLFLLSMLSRLDNVDLKVYENEFTMGKAIFMVKDEFLISGMLSGEDRCLSVTMCEGEKPVGEMYKVFSEMCNSKKLLFARKDIKDMLSTKEFMHALISPQQRWLCGQITELLLPDDMIDEIIPFVSEQIKADETYINYMKSISKLIYGVMENNPLRILIYENALYEFSVNGVINFLNVKIELNMEQKKRVLSHILKLSENPKVEIRLIHGRIVPDFRKIAPPSFVLSSTVSFLVIHNDASDRNAYLEINLPRMREIFSYFYEQLWDYEEGDIILSGKKMFDYVSYLLTSVEMLNLMNELGITPSIN